MSNAGKSSTSSAQHSAEKRQSNETAISEQRLEKDADEMAGEAEKTEKQYDEDHDIFTK